ncbi:ATP-binding cassette domain-containing protein [Micromonospora orduensis]|uniref:ABC transporter ATP-binding protein n=1 Tax=Micromonospora orduensis TaxID=1420891 RepID=UPI0038080338
MVAVEARGLGLRTRRGWVFRGVDLAIRAGEVHAIVGPPGSGRTSLLLALADRFPITEGEVRHHAPAALGQVAGVHEPDPELTVAEHITERLLLLGRRVVPAASATAARGRPRFGILPWRRRTGQRDAVMAAIESAGLGAENLLDPARRGRDLTPVQRQVLGLTLAALSGPGLILADDVDAGTSSTERALLWTILDRVASQGIAVVVTTREVEPPSTPIIHRLGEPPADPAGQASAEEETAAEQAPAEQAPAEQAPAEQAPAEQAPAEEETAEQAPAEEETAEQAPAEEETAEQAPAEEETAEQAAAGTVPTHHAEVTR